MKFRFENKEQAERIIEDYDPDMDNASYVVKREIIRYLKMGDDYPFKTEGIENG